MKEPLFQKPASLEFSRAAIEEDLQVNGYMLRREVDNRLELLIGKMASLKNNLEMEIQRLQTEGAEYTINSLGVVQTQGSDIDRLCGELAALKDVLRATGAWKESWR